MGEHKSIIFNMENNETEGIIDRQRPEKGFIVDVPGYNKYIVIFHREHIPILRIYSYYNYE
jgi:hypothetical protein